MTGTVEREDVVDDPSHVPPVDDGWRLGWGVAAALALFYGWFAVVRHEHLMTSGYDLGIFEQEVRSYAHFHWPTSTLKGPHFELLGDHFSPGMAVLAPFYRLFPSAITLLIAQALLVAVGSAPIVAWARRRAGVWQAVAVGVAYGLSWGVAEAIGFDVHEVMLAVPLLAFSCVALGERRLVAAVAWAAPLVLVKEDLGLTVAVVGLLVAFYGRRTLGAVTAACGVLATVIESYVIIPAVSEANQDAYTGQIKWTASTFEHVLSPETKLTTLLMVLAVTAFVAVRSPLVLLIVPTLAWRFLADNAVYWGTSYHYSLVLMPIVFAAMVDVLPRLRPLRVQWAWLAAALAVTLFSLPNHPFAKTGSLLHDDPKADAVRTLLDRIPDGATVSASNWLAPHLTGRDDVSLFGLTPLSESNARYVVVDFDPPLIFPISIEDTHELIDQAERDGYRQIGAASTVVLLERS